MTAPRHFGWRVEGKVGVITLNRPERKNPLTFESYAELRDFFRALPTNKDVKAIVLTGAGGNFCSGGDVHEIIGPLTKMKPPQLLEFTQMTGNLVKAMRHCPQPVIAAVEGVCAGAGAILAMASDLRYASPSARVAFLFVRVGLAGCDMGACATASMSIAWSTVTFHSSCSILFVTACAAVGPVASSLATFIASDITGSDTRLKKPHARPSSAPIERPV